MSVCTPSSRIIQLPFNSFIHSKFINTFYSKRRNCTNFTKTFIHCSRISMSAQPKLRFIDIAANLSDEMFKGNYNGKKYHDADIQHVLNRAWDAGVEKIIITGGSLKESEEALRLAELDDRLYCTVGVHPTRCMEFEESGNPDDYLKKLIELGVEGKRKGKTVAIGEFGLDYDRLQFCPKNVQLKYFQKQFELCSVLNLPLFLHMREATDDFIQIIQNNISKFKYGVVHSFTDSAESKDKILAIPKLYIGINGCSLKTEENLKTVSQILSEKILVETDCPYCEIRTSHKSFPYVSTFVPAKKKEKFDANSLIKNRNEPCNVRQVFEVIAKLQNVSDVEKFSETIFQTTSKIFFPSE